MNTFNSIPKQDFSGSLVVMFRSRNGCGSKNLGAGSDLIRKFWNQLITAHHYNEHTWPGSNNSKAGLLLEATVVNIGRVCVCMVCMAHMTTEVLRGRSRYSFRQWQLVHLAQLQREGVPKIGCSSRKCSFSKARCPANRYLQKSLALRAQRPRRLVFRQQLLQIYWSKSVQWIVNNRYDLELGSILYRQPVKWR